MQGREREGCQSRALREGTSGVTYRLSTATVIRFASGSVTMSSEDGEGDEGDEGDVVDVEEEEGGEW